MATTTDTSQVNGTQFTWGNQALLWSDSLADLRTWDVSYDTIAYTLTVGEAFDLSEGLSNGPRIAKSEVFAFVEARAAVVGMNPSEVIAFAEARSGLFSQALDEEFAVDEGLSNQPGKRVAETFAVAEARNANIGMNPSETIAFAEARSVSIGQKLYETLAVIDTTDKSAGLSIAESFDFAEAISKDYAMSKSETFAFAEVMSRSVGFIRNFSETLAVAESIANTYGLNKAETFRVVDAWRRQGDMVISDMMLSNAGNVTMEDFIDFMTYGAVPGYEKWRDFIPGDYEYREAMFRVVLESKNADRGLLTNLQATIDVPDLIDRGSTTIVSAATGAVVTYNRTFHIVPEITLAARGGVGGNPIAPEFYGSPTKTSFTVRLRDTVTGAYVTGSFTWAAHGY